MTGPTGYLTDTNVFVYRYDSRDPAKQRRAIAVTDRLAAQVTGFASTQILGEFFTVVTRKLPAPLSIADARRTVARITRFWTILPITSELVLEAIDGVQQHQLPYWDALIWATAKVNGIATVLSEDFNNGAVLAGVRFLEPFRAGFDTAAL
jgi:predicted nucleic acid-binding protein